MLKVRGTTVYPTAVFAALQGIEGVRNYCLEVYQDHELSDRPRVIVGLDETAAVTLEEIVERLRGRLRVKLDVVRAPVEEVRRKTTVDGRRKPVLVFDYRTGRKDGRVGHDTA
jgi:phenylacetate-CoA ligase